MDGSGVENGWQPRQGGGDGAEANFEGKNPDLHVQVGSIEETVGLGPGAVLSPMTVQWPAE